MNKNLKSNIALWFLVSTLVYFILIFLFQKTDLDYTFIFNKFELIIAVTFMVCVVYFFKYFKWLYILKKNSIDIKKNNQIEIFIKSLLYSFTPGKVGEFIKAYYLKEKYSIDLNKGIYFTLLEKATEIISLFILFIALYFSIIYAIILLFILVVLIYFIFSCNSSLEKSYKNKLVNNILDNLVKIKGYFNIKQLSLYIYLILISILLWLIEAGIFSYLITNNFFNITLAFNYLISMFLGTISFLPAGIGLSDFSLNYLLIKDGIDEKLAIFSVIIFRFITVWIPVIFSALYTLSIYVSNYLNKKKSKK